LVLRLTCEIAVGLAVVWAAAVEQKHNPPPTLGVPWTLFLAFTVLVFAPLLAKYRKHWRRASYWAVVVGLLVIHFSWWTKYIRSWFFGFVGGGGGLEFPVLVWMLWGLAECGLIRALFYWRYSPDRETISLGAFLDQAQSSAKSGEGVGKGTWNM
jgi:hypothetical protein